MVDTADLSIVTKVEKEAIYSQFRDDSKITVTVLKNRERQSPSSFVANFNFALAKIDAVDES